MFMFKWSKSYYWLSFNGLKSIISMNRYEHLQSRKTIIENKSRFLIDNRQNLCEHGGLHTMTARKVKYIPGKVYNYMKEIFIKIGNIRVCWDIIQVKKSPISLTMTYQIAIWDVKCVSKNCGMKCQKNYLLKELHSLVKASNKPDTSPREEIYGVCK